MPELPEVENYRRDLQNLLVGRRFTGVYIDWPRQVAVPDVETFKARLPGQVITQVGRRGKYLVFHLSRDFLLIHLRMSGRLHVEPTSAPPDPHAHVVLRLDGREELRFRDPRKFGRVYLVDDPRRVVEKLGPEPLEEGFTAERLAEMLARRRGRIKSLLLNQEFLAGLGNIYADEALHAAGIHPLRPADTLTHEEVRRLHAAIRATLLKAIEQRGTTFDGFYLDARGRPGRYQSRLAVYGRAGEPCLGCGTPIQRIVVGQRGTHFCPRCQPAGSERV
jgi:formamidopyrimidine-DNA glycosylase